LRLHSGAGTDVDAGLVIHPLADQARLSAFQGDVETGQSSPVELSIKVTRSSRVSSGNTS
jgi:hypothetical protein